VGLEPGLQEEAETDLYIKYLLEVEAMSHFSFLVICPTDLLIAPRQEAPIRLLYPFSHLHLFLTCCWTFSALQVWWTDPVWISGAYQSCPITPFLSQTGETKFSKRLMDRDKDRESSLSSYHHTQNRLDFGKLV